MANVFQMLKRTSHRHKIVKLHELCCKGIADKPVKGFKNVTLTTWVELMGYYSMAQLHQENRAALSRQARSVLSQIGL